jgi:hypothetical protein
VRLPTAWRPEVGAHPEKTKIGCCKDVNQRGDFPNVRLDFLGFQIRARKIMWVKADRRIFAHNFHPAASRRSLTRISRDVRTGYAALRATRHWAERLTASISRPLHPNDRTKCCEATIFSLGQERKIEDASGLATRLPKGGSRCSFGSEYSLAGILEMLRNFPTDGQFDITVDVHVDDHWAVLDGKRFIDLTEIVGPIDSEALGPKTDGQFFEIRLSNFRIFGRETFVY